MKAAPIWIGLLRWTTLIGLVLLLPLTLYAGNLGLVLTDVDFYTQGLARWGWLERLGSLAADAAINAAVQAAQQQNDAVLRTIRSLDEANRALIAQTLLPPTWTAAWFESSLERTLLWLHQEDARPIPPLALPVGDVKRHLSEAISLLYDRAAAQLPPCGSTSTWCRPADMSLVAYTATYKPVWMAAAAGALEWLPPDLDLAAAVSLSPQTFRQQLDTLADLRRGLRLTERIWGAAAWACLILAVGVWWSHAGSPQTALHRLGAGLSAAGGLTVLCSILAVWGWAAWSDGQTALNPSLQIVAPAVTDALTVAQARSWSWVVGLAGGGLALIGLSLATRQVAQNIKTSAWMFAGATAGMLLLGWLYVNVGQRWATQAGTALNGGDMNGAAASFERWARWYPLPLGAWSAPARRGLRQCRRWQAAESLLDNGHFEMAAQQFEALWATDMPIEMRQRVQTQLVESLYGWAGSLRQAGDHERALDRYHFVRDELADEQIHQTIADMLVVWGDELLAQGDYGGATTIYERLSYEVPGPRLWVEARRRTATAYCDWAAALPAERAAPVCRRFAASWAAADFSTCAACASFR